MNASTLALIGQVLTQAEQFISGQAVNVTIPTETLDVGGIKVEISGTLSIKKG